MSLFSDSNIKGSTGTGTGKVINLDEVSMVERMRAAGKPDAAFVTLKTGAKHALHALYDDFVAALQKFHAAKDPGEPSRSADKTA